MSKNVMNRIERESNLFASQILLVMCIASALGMVASWLAVVPASGFTTISYILIALDMVARIVLIALIRRKDGEGEWLKWLTTGYFIVFAFGLSLVMERICWIMFAIPVLHMARYYNTRNTNIAGIASGVAGIAFNCLTIFPLKDFSLLNPGYVTFSEDTALSVRKGLGGMLYEAITNNFDKVDKGSLLSYMILDSMIFAAAMACITYLAAYISKQGKHIVDESLSEQLEYTLEEVELQTIIESVSEEYECLINFDVENQNINYYRVSGNLGYLPKIWAEDREWDDRMLSFADRFIAKNERADFLSDVSYENLETQLAENKTYSVNHKLMINGNSTWYQLRFMKNKAHEGHRCILLGCRNIEREIRMQQQQNSQLEEQLKKAENASEAKTRFLFNMSHDLRTPMNAVMGFADIAKKSLDNRDKVAECLDKLEASGSQLLNIINDILELSRIEAGQIKLSVKAVDIRTTDAPIGTVIEPILREKNIKFIRSSEIRDNLIFMDITHVNRIIFNVLENAAKFTSDGGTIEYRLRQLEDTPKGRAVFEWSITDTGIGMSKDFLAHIFDRFSKEKSANGNGLEGTGLGMALVKELVEAMDGSIKVDSEQGVGTTVVFTIPFDKCNEWEFNAVNLPPVTERTFEGVRALLVEDIELNCEIATDFLEEKGVHVTSVNNGREALELIRKSGATDFDIIFMDIQMPVMDGYEATRCIRALPNRELANIPIVAMTANAFEEDRKIALSIGMNDHIAKPVDREKLTAALTKWVK